MNYPPTTEALYALLEKVQQGLDEVSISHFTDDELALIKALIEFHL